MSSLSAAGGLRVTICEGRAHFIEKRKMKSGKTWRLKREGETESEQKQRERRKRRGGSWHSYPAAKIERIVGTINKAQKKELGVQPSCLTSAGMWEEKKGGLSL